MIKVIVNNKQVPVQTNTNVTVNVIRHNRKVKFATSRRQGY